MSAVHDIVFLFDVDNTLLDNDRVLVDLRKHIGQFGEESAKRYWTLFEELRTELGYADYLGALQRYRREKLGGLVNDPRLLLMSSYLVDYPFANRLYPAALDVLEHCARWGPTVILTDGDVVFQPRKIQRAGLWDAVEGRVLIYVHKEQMLEDVELRYPARRYVMVDDKLRILSAMKKIWGARLTTVFPRQGHYALDLKSIAGYPAADVSIERIGELLAYELPGFQRQRRCATETMSEVHMKSTQTLHDLGQSIWLDNITRALLASGTLRRYVDEFSVTGLTSNPTIFDQAIGGGAEYDAAIQRKAGEGKSGEALFFELAIEDLRQAADLFRPVFEATGGIDGWASLELSPLLASDTAGSTKAAVALHAQTARPNIFIKIPGTAEGIPAIEAAIFAGVPVNVTLLFSREHYLAAAEAYLRGIERRVAAGLDPRVASVASVFVSRWDVAVKDKVPPPLRNRLGIAVAMRTYKTYRDLLAAPRWQALARLGAHPQRLLWASTGSKDPAANPALYIAALAAPDTINTMPEKTLLGFAAQGAVAGTLPADGGDAEQVLAEFRRAGIDDAALAADLQRDGAAAFTKSWGELMNRIAEKSRALAEAGNGALR